MREKEEFKTVIRFLVLVIEWVRIFLLRWGLLLEEERIGKREVGGVANGF